MPLGANKAAIMGVAGVSTGDVVLLNTITATSDAAISFTSGITSTYGEYIFRFYNLNPETNGDEFAFQVNATDGADYNDSEITSTQFRAEQNQTGADRDFAYLTANDQANGTAFQRLCHSVGSGADESLAGELHLFNPASTTYVKHFYARVTIYHGSDYASEFFTGGYINDATAIDDIQFKFEGGDFDGKIKMWGVKN
jgi:hypothetical protein